MVILLDTHSDDDENYLAAYDRSNLGIAPSPLAKLEEDYLIILFLLKVEGR